jgi:DNA repair protein SbcD/Mre11
MRAQFLHVSDVHLGYQQYGEKERFNDFARALRMVVQEAIDAGVDFVVLAGDLFHKRAIDALTLNQATVILEHLKSAGIPCIAVEGNHEQAYYRERIGWMEFLAERDLLYLLNPTGFLDGRPELTPYSARRGAYFDPVPGLRVYGLRYMGASTAKAIEGYAETLAQQPHSGIEYTILVTHAGIENVLPGHAGGLSHRQLAPLRPHIDYLALGHIHKPFSFDDWIFNPGSPETCSMEEVAWQERGYYLVQVDTDRDTGDGEPKHIATLQANQRRPFHRLQVKVDLLGSPQALHSHCREFIERKARDLLPAHVTKELRPVVELRLAGTLTFDRSALDLTALQQMVIAAFQPLHCQIKNATRPTEFAIQVDTHQNRSELERQIVTELLERDARFREHGDAWAALTLTLKQLALTGSSPDSLLQELEQGTAMIAQMSDV